MAATKHGGSVKVHTLTWTSDSGGAATQAFHVDGEIVRVVTDPAAGGSAPSDDYDITFVDEDGFDIINGDLANRDTANTESVIPDPRVWHYGTVTATIAAAGDTKSGTIKVYVR